MAMNIYCNNDDCRKEGPHKLHTDTNEVICEFCQRPITNVSHFAKEALKTMGQIYRGEEKPQKAFSVQCQSCGKNDTPFTFKGELYCKHCNAHHAQITGPYKQMLVQNVGGAR